MGTNLLLIVREELVCLFILAFILFYGQLYEMGKDAVTLKKLCLYSIGHVVFDIITVITVNHTDTVPSFVNWACHVIFYVFALLFTEQLLIYTAGLVYEKHRVKRLRRYSVGLLVVFTLAMLVLPIEYRTGNGTMYSYGPAVYAGYGLAMVFLLASLFIIVKEARRLPTGARTSLVPMLFFAVAMIIIQAAVPELLFTGAAITIISVGFFFSLANPIVALQQKANTDVLTGVSTRRRYQEDMLQMGREYQQGTGFTFLFFDINDLKMVNDTFGHLEGDAYIAKTASIMSRTLVSTQQVYRMGGDEFLAVYRNSPEDLIRREISSFLTACEAESKSLPYRISVAVGYASTGKQYACLSDVLRAADFQMYLNKVEQKRQRSCQVMQKTDQNISGLTDRLLDSFVLFGSDEFLFVANLSTNVTRISESLMATFGFEDHFVSDFRSAWIQRVHPDDRNTYQDELTALVDGYKDHQDFFCRVIDKNGACVHCHCRGIVLRGRGSDPDLFVSFIRKVV